MFYESDRVFKMAFNEDLAWRIREALRSQPGVTEKKMFGGISFMLNGNMCCGVVGDELMARVGAEQQTEALAQPHAKIMDFTGRPMKGYVFVSPAGTATDDDLSTWVGQAVAFVKTLPPKQK